MNWSNIILFGYIISILPISYTILRIRCLKEKNLATIFFFMLGFGIFLNLLAGIILRTSVSTGLTHKETKDLVAPMRIFEIFNAWTYYFVFNHLNNKK
jgi:hypothetical protein